ncbi:helix-turn-helix transcriptional regulator [Ectobacillus antri]|uniref:helix-turn-helix transcriptional regulator n=1 Tax=Ectobacillus antri TaxID=2486280 RepID=UPI000F5B189B|nr:helix-turn-helix transcriptional regulator [Ectobacillus antri]
MKIICRLKVIFAERNIKQTVFAEKIQLSRTTLSSLVNNQALPSLTNAYIIAKELGLPIEEIWIPVVENKKDPVTESINE